MMWLHVYTFLSVSYWYSDPTFKKTNKHVSHCNMFKPQSEKTTSPSIVRRRLTFIHLKCDALLRRTRGDALLVVSVNLQKVEFPGFPWAVINAGREGFGVMKEWECVRFLFSCPGSSAFTVWTLSSWQPTSKTHNPMWVLTWEFNTSMKTCFQRSRSRQTQTRLWC